MCTLAVLRSPGADHPLVVAANRDERMDRPAESWSVRSGEKGMRYLAPLDVTAGGTWMGLNQAGVVVAITNHHTGLPPDPSRHSRGELVERALSLRSAVDAKDALEAIPYLRFNAFHLLVADATHAWLWHGDATQSAWEALSAGVHVITESAAHDDGPRAALVRTVMRAGADRAADPSALHAMLATHADPPRHGTCLHIGDLYGTRSSAVLRLGRAPGLTTLDFTDGAPCRSPVRSGAALLNTLNPAPVGA